jgi:hypothetical protein
MSFFAKSIKNGLVIYIGAKKKAKKTHFHKLIKREVMKINNFCKTINTAVK